MAIELVDGDFDFDENDLEYLEWELLEEEARRDYYQAIDEMYAEENVREPIVKSPEPEEMDPETPW